MLSNIKNTPMEEKKSFLKQKIDLKSPNKNIVPITISVGDDGKLSVGGCCIEELVKKYDSPLYILDEVTLRNSCRAYKKALEKYYPGKSLPIYASKANSSIFMSNLISSEGFGLDAVSEGELLTALKGGVPNEKIVFHGNNKSDKEIEFAVRNNIKVGKFKLFFSQALTTELEIVLTHSSIEGGSSFSVYLIPKPPPTFSFLISWPNFLASKMTFTIISPRSLCGSSSKIWEPI